MNPYRLISHSRAVANSCLVATMLALAAAPAQAGHGDLRNTTKTNLHHDSGSRPNVKPNRPPNNSHRPPDVNVNRPSNVNVNVNRPSNVNVNVNHGGGYYGGGNYNRGPSVGAVVAATIATAIVVGAVVNSLPPNCNTVFVNGLAYQNCGGNYYQPQYQGSSVNYVVVNHP
jgi:hypothetical protein